MLQIRIHGRGGQGVVTAAEMLSVAAFEQGRHAQAFPSFGSERTGAPVVAFCRIDAPPAGGTPPRLTYIKPAPGPWAKNGQLQDTRSGPCCKFAFTDGAARGW